MSEEIENEKITRTISNLLSLAPARKGRKKEENALVAPLRESVEDDLVKKVVDKEIEEKAPNCGNVDYKEWFDNLMLEFQREREKTTRLLDENDALEAKIETLEKKLKFNEKYIAILKEGAEKSH